MTGRKPILDFVVRVIRVGEKNKAYSHRFWHRQFIVRAVSFELAVHAAKGELKEGEAVCSIAVAGFQ